MGSSNDWSSFVPLLHLARLRLNNLLRRHLAPLQLTPFQYTVLHLVEKHDSISEEELRERMGVTATEILCATVPLYDRGLLERRCSRSQNITLNCTPLGESILHAVSCLRLQDDLLECLSRSEADQLLKLVKCLSGTKDKRHLRHFLDSRQRLKVRSD